MASGTAKVVKQTAIGTGSRVFRLAHERATFEGLHIRQSEDGQYYAELDAGHEPGSIWEKLPGAFVHQFIENGSEHAGKLFKGPSAPAQEALAKQAIFQAIAQKAGVKRAMRFLSRGNERLEKMQVQGTAGELFEEYVAVAGHAVFEGEPFVLPTSREITSMMASLLLVRGANGMGGMAFGGEGQAVGAGGAGGAGVQAPGADGMDVAAALGEVAPGANAPAAAGVSGGAVVHQEPLPTGTDAKDRGPQLSFAAADPAANDPVARRAIELGADPKRFRRGKPSRSKDLGQIFADYSLKENEVVISPYTLKDATVAQSYLVTHKAGGKAIVNITKDGTVWVDTQEMKDVPRDPETGLEIPRKESEKPEPIRGGDLIYQAAMTYAYNNGLKFRSDPSGTTEIAKYRRISHMLSSALRHGTTRHLTPYGKKKKDNDLVANEWREEDTPENFEHNVGLMLRAEMKFVQSVLNSSDQKTDVKFEELRYDPASDNVLQQVKDEHGTLAGWRRISERDFKAIVDRLVARDSGVGPTTLSRALITKSEVARNARGLGSETHVETAQLYEGGRVPAGTGVGLFRLLGTAENPNDLYYSRGEASGSERIQRTGVTRAETTAAEARLKSTAQGRAIYGNVLIVDNRAALDGQQGRPGQQRYHAEDWDIMQDAEGFHDPRDGTVVIFRENVRVLEGETAAQALARVVVHERVGHHGFDALRNSDSKFAKEWAKLALAIPKKDMEDLERRYTNLNGNREALALEWFAHQVGNVGGRAQLEPGSVAQQMWQAMRDWVVRQLSAFGDPSKQMSQEVIDAHVRGLIRATQRSMVKGARGRREATAQGSAATPDGPGPLAGGRTQFSMSPNEDHNPVPQEPTTDELPAISNIDSNIPIPYVQQHGQGTESRRDAQAALGALLARAEDDDRANAQADAGERIRSESQSLVSWARENGWLIEPAGFARLTPSFQEFEGGAEHQVFGVPKAGRVMKITRPPNFGARGKLTDYLKNIKCSNALFQDDIRIEGIVETNAGPAMVISQPFVAGKSPDIKEVKAWFGEQGYQPAGENTWRHPDTGAMITDAHPRNFIITEDKALVPIDLQVLNPGRDILEQAKEASEAR